MATRQPKTERMSSAQENWVLRELATIEHDFAQLRAVCPDLLISGLWAHAETPEGLISHVREVMRTYQPPYAAMHAAMHVGELSQALKIAAHRRTEELAAQTKADEITSAQPILLIDTGEASWPRWTQTGT